ncbi:hypothetical protein GF389_05430 [Candidatus Dojkabacteria bacterium]|nr:hypothetical protein [Candidatus Dojkabacteria bacterium]
MKLIEELMKLSPGYLPGEVFVKNVFEGIDRGMELSLLYRLELESEVNGFQYFDVNQLPENLVETDVSRIRTVLA